MARGSSGKSSSSKESNNGSSTKSEVPLSWKPLCLDQVIIPSQSKPPPSEGADVQVNVKSRQVKGLTTCPSDCLFRTHQYEFVITPSMELLEWAGCKFGYYAMIKLFTLIIGGVNNSDDDDEDESANASEQQQHPQNDDHWMECFSDDSTPVILQSFMEDYDKQTVWKITLYWPTSCSYKFNSKATFRFEIDVFRSNASNRDEMKKVATKISSPFRVLSKPEVYLKSISKPPKKKAKSSTTITTTSGRQKKNNKRKKSSKSTTESSEDVVETEESESTQSMVMEEEPPQTKLKTDPSLLLSSSELVLESGEAFFSFPSSPPLFTNVVNRGVVGPPPTTSSSSSSTTVTPQSPILPLGRSSCPQPPLSSSDLNISSLSCTSENDQTLHQAQPPPSSSQEFFTNFLLTPPLSQQGLQSEDVVGDSFFNAEFPSLSQSSNNMLPSQ
nr:unnamed protein product [Naegleria fowleri]